MNNFLFKDRVGQTPLLPELQKGLRLKHIQNMDELDEYEEKNIAEGLAWLESSNEDYGTYNFWRKLHKKLFGDVWTWAGEIRKHELANPYFYKPYQIWPSFIKLEDDLKYWLDKKEIPFCEITARFHEKIETIHPFTNGNGRFGRILVEYFCRKENEQIPTWGAVFKNDPKTRRRHYIESLDYARQKSSYEPLVKFMFS